MSDAHSMIRNAQQEIDERDRLRNEKQLFKKLGATYSPKRYVLLSQVRSSPTLKARTADAVAIGYLKSHGLSIDGFEIKASRADWLNELKDPLKAEEIGQYCDRWWVVASSDKIVRPDELPENWGLYVDTGRNYLKTEKGAKAIQVRPVDRDFIAALVKRLVEQYNAPRELVPEEQLAAAHKKGREEALVEAEAKFRDAHHSEILNLVEVFSEQLAKQKRIVTAAMGEELSGLSPAIVDRMSEVINAASANFGSRGHDDFEDLLRLIEFIQHVGISGVVCRILSTLQSLKKVADELSTLADVRAVSLKSLDALMTYWKTPDVASLEKP